MSRSASVDGINKNNSNNKLQTAEVAVQVNLTKCASSPSVNKKTKDKLSEESVGREHGDIICPAYIPVDGNIRPGVERRLTRGFSHDDTLGGDEKRYSWREELEKFRSQKKPLGVSDLIDAFTNKTLQRKVSSDDPSFPSVDSMKNKRRGSLQIQIDSNAFAKLSETTESQKSNNAIKLQRRKSTSAILPLRLSEVKMPDIEEDASSRNKSENSINEKYKNISEKAVSEINSDESEPNNEGSSESINAPYFNQSLPKGRVYLEKVNERKRTWDYFEINHPKAISDKKLEQLKAKYTRRKTEADILSKTESDKNHHNQILARKPAAEVKPLPVRTHSMPVIEASLESAQTKKPLELALDPLTGECLNTCDTVSIDSGRESEAARKLSSDSCEENASSRKSSCRRSSQLGNITEAEKRSPEEISVEVEVFIDPFTGQFITNEVSKHSTGKSSNPDRNKKNLQVNTKTNEKSQQDDDGIGSLPDTPTESSNSKSLSLSRAPMEDINGIPPDDGISTSSEGVAGSGSGPADSVGEQVTVSSEPSCEASKLCTGMVSRAIEKLKEETDKKNENC